jgi:hypothetical protein
MHYVRISGLRGKLQPDPKEKDLISNLNFCLRNWKKKGNL